MGRKPETPKILGDSPTPWRHEHLVLDTRATYGRVNLPAPADVIAALSRADAPQAIAA
jgi:hypothetical protein